MFDLSRGIETLVDTLKSKGVSFEHEPNDAKTYWHLNDKMFFLIQKYRFEDEVRIKSELNARWEDFFGVEVFLEDNIANLSKACRDGRITIRYEPEYGGCQGAIVVNRK